VNATRASFNGPNGVKAEPTAEQKAAAEKKVPPTSQQLARQEAASKDPKLQASTNKGHPNADAIKSFNQQHGKGTEGTGAVAGTEKAGNKAGTVSEHGGLGADAANAGKHGNEPGAENLHGNKQHLKGTEAGAHSGKPPGYAGNTHGQHAMMQGPHHPAMGAYHPQSGENRAHATGQQQGKKKSGKPEQR